VNRPTSRRARGAEHVGTHTAPLTRSPAHPVMPATFVRVHPLTRPIGGRAALAFPNHVPPTGARDIEDEKVSGQQPVTTWTALGWSIHPLPVGAGHPLANLSSHTDHISSPYLGNPGRIANCDYSVVSWVFSVRVTVGVVDLRRSSAPPG
jgi:hypothetical protein